MDTPTLVGWIIGIVIGAIVGYWLGGKKGRPVLGLALGAVLTLIGWIIILVIPKKDGAA